MKLTSQMPSSTSLMPSFWSARTMEMLIRFLLLPLARLIAQASKLSQAVVVPHATALVSALGADPDCTQIVLEKHPGEAIIRDGTPPDWTWPSR
jgi:predicted ATPase